MCKIYIKPWLFIRPLLIFKGAYETASLSWYFCVKAKGQEKRKNKNTFEKTVKTLKVLQHIAPIQNTSPAMQNASPMIRNTSPLPETYASVLREWGFQKEKYWFYVYSGFLASRGAAPSCTPTKGHGATTRNCRGDFLSHPDNVLAVFALPGNSTKTRFFNASGITYL